MSDENRSSDDTTFFQRRDFVKLVAAVTAIAPATAVVGQESAPQPQPALLPNSQGPATQFQAALSGNAAYLEKNGLSEQVSRRETIEVEPWVGPVPQEATEIAYLPVHRLAALIRDRKLSPVELTDIYLARLKQLNPTVLCAVNILEATAKKEAKQAAAEIADGQYRGPLHGIPWGVKDLFSTRGAVTSWGAKPYENRVIEEDAEMVVRMREAGAVLVAKLATGTFAQGDRWFRGMTRNPWDIEEGSSGSSAGPGSATAAGCVGFSLGTETRGSIVSPSKRCGISALRPTYGRVSRHGCMTLSWTMDKVGPMCRTIEDCALVFNVIHGSDGKDPSTLTAPFSFRRQPNWSQLRIGVRDDVDEQFVSQLRELGAEPIPIGEPPDHRNVNQILNTEAAAAFDDFISNNLDEGMVRKARVRPFRSSREVSALDYINAQRKRYALMQEMDAYFGDFDMYATDDGDVALTNLTGHPAAIVPFTIRDGQPRCMTLIGKLFADDLILSVAHAYQSATKWHLDHPAI